MSSPSVVSIHTGRSGAPLSAQPVVVARPGKGLDGDRYADGTGTFYKPGRPDIEVTLIEIEALEALNRDYGVELAAGDARRNIVTRGVSLNHLVGKRFTVGGATFEGIRLCEPCGHLAKLTSDRVRQGLIHRGGLRARVITEGEIRAGDSIAVVA